MRNSPPKNVSKVVNLLETSLRNEFTKPPTRTEDLQIAFLLKAFEKPSQSTCVEFKCPFPGCNLKYMYVCTLKMHLTAKHEEFYRKLTRRFPDMSLKKIYSLLENMDERKIAEIFNFVEDSSYAEENDWLERLYKKDLDEKLLKMKRNTQVDLWLIHIATKIGNLDKRFEILKMKYKRFSRSMANKEQ